MKDKDYTDLLDEVQKSYEKTEKQASVCPKCGRCPTCGRRYNDGRYKDFPPYRYPVTPYWGVSQEVWC